MNEVSSASKQYGKPWAAATASVVCAGAALYFFNLYSTLHWQVLHKHYSELSESLKQPLFQMLSMLEAYRIFGVLAVVFAVWAITQRPRWPGAICLAPALAALFASIVIM